MLLSTKKEGRVFGLASGAQLAEFAPNSFQNHGLAVSADGRFIAVPSFTAEVKVGGGWDICGACRVCLWMFWQAQLQGTEEGGCVRGRTVHRSAFIRC